MKNILFLFECVCVCKLREKRNVKEILLEFGHTKIILEQIFYVYSILSIHTIIIMITSSFQTSLISQISLSKTFKQEYVEQNG
jgi:hypothetical protein